MARTRARAFRFDFVRRLVHASLVVALAAFGAGCATPGAGEGTGSAGLVASLKNARLIDLSHTWEAGSPLASVNPPYSFALGATHAKTRGTFNDGGQLSFAAEQMHWSGQHGAPSIDALGHIGRHGKLFGGVDAAAATADPAGIDAGGVGAKLAIDQFPAELLVNRGVLLDVATMVRGDASPLPADFEITAAHLEQAAQRQGIRL